MTRAAVRARGPLTRVPVVRSCCANISVHCVQVSPYAFCMFAHEVLMPFEVKRKCSIPRVSLFLPPHRINIGSLSCRCIRIPCDEAARDAISSIVPRRRDIARRSEEGKTVAGHADPRISLDLDRRERGIVYDMNAPAGTPGAHDLSGPRGTRYMLYRARPTIVRTGLRNRGISRSRDPPPVVIGVPIAQGPTIGNELMIVTDTNPPRTATRLLVLTILHVHERRPDARHPTSIGVFTRVHTVTLGCLA